MKKKLKLDELQVESFRTTTDPAGQRGTVRGHESFNGTCQPECSYPTFYNACNETVTYGEATCYCMVEKSDVRYCNTAWNCSGGGMC